MSTIQCMLFLFTAWGGIRVLFRIYKELATMNRLLKQWVEQPRSRDT